ncbi:hypothetical protein MFIFM68171_00944 [Madurella fahalii]|uniref:Uncharacterized protein n=1 Tax=Madurella fahalii TaxID=1157608 RepID=A0ABQ0FZ14_9PEZI
MSSQDGQEARPAKRKKTVRFSDDVELFANRDEDPAPGTGALDGAAREIDRMLAVLKDEDDEIKEVKRRIRPLMYTDEITNPWRKRELKRLLEFCAEDRDVAEISVLMDRSMSSVYFALSRILKESEDVEQASRARGEWEEEEEKEEEEEEGEKEEAVAEDDEGNEDENDDYEEES